MSHREITTQDTDTDLASLEKRRMVEPDEVPNDGPLFSAMSLEEQRAEIKDHIRKHPCDAGLISEALSEYSRDAAVQYGAMLDSYFAGDLRRFASLADFAIRNYIGAEIQRLWDEERR